MKNSRALTYSPMKLTLPILNRFNADIEITENPYNIPVEQFFDMAARINKKRSFLFVSKILGKHIPIHPSQGLITGALLANRYLEVVHKQEDKLSADLLKNFYDQEKAYPLQSFVNPKINPVIIGFAETATALGHAFYSCFQNSDFFHTTREQLVGIDPIIAFEEEHSHATSHRCYIDRHILDNDREIILVDDEMTTGKTAVNIIRSIHKRFPRKTYTVVSILDWRSDENLCLYNELETELGITIHSVSLLKGTVNISGSPNLADQPLEEYPEAAWPAISYIYIDQLFPNRLTPMAFTSVTLDGNTKQTPYLKETGRFGLNSEENRKLDQALNEIGRYLTRRRTGKRTLCLGTGEFMFIPMKLAALMGQGVCYQSTTRSPIYVTNQERYGARYGFKFPNPEDHQIDQFIYNISPNEYDEIFLFFERQVSAKELQPFLNKLGQTKINNLKIVFFNN